MAGNDQRAVLRTRNQSLVIYRDGSLPVPYNGNQQPVIYGTDQPTNTYHSSQQILYNNFATLAGTGKPVHYIHNEGNASFSDTFNPDQHTITYNGPTSTVSFYGSGSGSGFDSKRYHVFHRCRECREEFDSEKDLERHRKDYPQVCEQHQMCHASWTHHIKRYPHTKCPISSCRNEYTSEAQFTSHYNLRHR